jgi:hypothetical protein
MSGARTERTDVRESVVLILVAVLVTFGAGFWAWHLASAIFAPVPLISSPGTIVIATKGGVPGRNDVDVYANYNASLNQQYTNFMLNFSQQVEGNAARTKAPVVIVFLCGAAAESPHLQDEQGKLITWQPAPFTGQSIPDIGYPSQCSYASVTLTEYGGIRSASLSGYLSPRPSQVSGAGVIYAWPGITILPLLARKTGQGTSVIEPAPPQGSSQLDVNVDDLPNDISNVVSDPQMQPGSGGLQWIGKFGRFGIPATQYRLSGDLADLQAEEQRDLFIAGALVGVAGAGVILFLEQLTKMVIALRGPAEASTDTRTERSEPAAQIMQKSQVEPAPLVQGGEPGQPAANAERTEQDQHADENVAPDGPANQEP